MSKYTKRKAGAASIILWIIGVILIVGGLIFPQILLKEPKYTFAVDVEDFGSKYEFEVDIREQIKVDSAVAKIKLTNGKTKEYNLQYDAGDSEFGEYIFNLTLDFDEASVGNEVVEVQLTTQAGKVISFENESKYTEADAKKILLILTPMIIGLVFIVLGRMYMVYVHDDEKKNVDEKTINEITTKVMEKIEENPAKSENQTIACEFCKLENNATNVKCEHCGAPLIRDKK